MANTTLGKAAAGAVDESFLTMLAGPHDMGSVRMKTFTATAGTGNAPAAGFTLDLSGLFENKVLAVFCTPLYNPTIAAGSLATPVMYVPGTTPANGKLYVLAANADGQLLKNVADDTRAVNGFVVQGIAIGY